MAAAIEVDYSGSWRRYAEGAMNRIREIREAAGLTQEALAEKVGTTGNHIWRLESGRAKLTQAWMVALAEALNCHPADFMQNVVASEVITEVEPFDATPITNAIASRGIKVYRVTARNVMDAGIKPGDVITVDETAHAVDNVKLGDIVLVEMGPDRSRGLRQFIPPRTLITNRPGADLAIKLNDPTVSPKIVGVVLRDVAPLA